MFCSRCGTQLPDDARACTLCGLALAVGDPLREEGHETLIKVYGASGSRSQVHRQFRRLRAVLEREIGVEPLPQTMAAYRLALAATVERSRLQAASSVFAPRHGMAAFAGRT